MTTITKIDRASCKKLRHLLNAELAPLAHRTGLKIEPGNATFDPSGFVTFKVRIELDGFDRRKHEFDHDCWALDLDPMHYELEFEFSRRRYKLVGVKPRSPKYPILAEALEGPDGGKVYKLPRTAMGAIMGAWSKALAKTAEEARA